MIFDHLYYQGYRLRKIRNDDLASIRASDGFVLMSVFYTIGAIVFIIEGVIRFWGYSFGEAWLIPIIILAIPVFLYYRKERREEIYRKYLNKAKDKKINVHPLVTLILYHVLAFGLILLAGFFRNRDWTFSNL